MNLKKNGNSGLDKTKLVLVVLIIFALIQLFIQVSFLFQGTEFIASSLTIDDTYYYLQTAWNLKNHGISSFDTINQTNGFQLLWFLIVYLISLVSSTKAVYLFVVLLVCFLFNTGVYYFIYRIGKISDLKHISVLFGVLWFTRIISYHYYFSGMENSLHAFIIWWMIYEFLRVIQGKGKNENPKLVLFSVLLVLNVWTRLDAGIFSALFYVTVLLVLLRRSESIKALFAGFAKEIFKSILIIIGGGLLMLAAFCGFGGSLLPVSALIKTAGGSMFAIDNNFLNIFLERLSMSFSYSGLFPSLSILISVAGIIAILVVFRITCKRYLKSMDIAWLLMLSGIIIYHLYLAGSQIGYHEYFFWYRTLFHIFSIMTTGMIFLFVGELVSAFKREFIFSIVIYCFSLLLFLTSFNTLNKGLDHHPMLNAQYRTGIWIKENIPSDKIMASWNAGQIGFFSDRSVINLDGLINSYEYFKQISKKNFSLYKYLKKKGVDYIVDYCCIEKNGLIFLSKLVKRIETKKGWKPIQIRELL